MLPFLLWSLVGFSIWIVASSFFEWLLHRYVMHRPVKWFRYPFQAHAVVHHHTFKADHTYHLIKESDKETIPMAWWNGPALIVVFTLPMVPVSWFTGIWALTCGAALGMTTYYCVYEYLHWCMHLPKARQFECFGLFRRINGHHILHHRYMHKNFNVILPIADLCLGTLMRRSRVRFAQVQGPSVPNLQPHGFIPDQTVEFGTEAGPETMPDREAA